MAIDLSTAKNGEAFVTEDGTSLNYYSIGNSYAYSPYIYCMKSAETGNRLFYSKEGIYMHSEHPGLNLVGCTRVVEEGVTPSTPLDSSNDIAIGWEMILKVVGWIFVIFGIIGGLILIGLDFEEMCWYPFIVGILVPAPMMVFANISISLKEANVIQKNILKEIKQMNKKQDEVK
ncbi:MAG: hypothetical protein UHD64_10775 [Bacteroidales bacterium]|nr:hypothetical protein [Bacteroidales bacterium]